MSKSATKTPPKGPQYPFDYPACKSTSPLGPKIPMVSTTMKLKKTLIVKKLII